MSDEDEVGSVDEGGVPGVVDRTVVRVSERRAGSGGKSGADDGPGGESGRAVDRPRRWKRPESVLVVVHSDAGDVLLLQRRDDPTFWQSVTGSLEEGETPAAAARRELAEETGLELPVHDLELRTTFEIRPPWRARYAPGVTRNLEHAFTARVAGAKPVTLSPEEHLDFLWLPAVEALERVSSPTNREPIRRLLAAAKGAR